MAERRMLTRKITNNDNFTTLPATAQALYLHIVMSADDDGFCDQASTAMFRAHAKPKDLNLLLERRYLLKFDSGVFCIKHWRMANTGRSDRYTPTAYKDEYSQLAIKENKAYTLATAGNQNGNHDDGEPPTERQPLGAETATVGIPSGNQTATAGNQNGNHLATQNRREENRREKNNIYTHTRAREGEAPEKDPDGFEAFWATYPRKSGDIKEAYMTYLDALADGANPGTLITAAQELAERNTSPEDFRHIPSAEKWLRNKAWLEKPPEQKAKISKTEAFVSAGREHKYTQDEMNALIEGLEKI